MEESQCWRQVSSTLQDSSNATKFCVVVTAAGDVVRALVNDSQPLAVYRLLSIVLFAML
jgi:hypothetical protein